MIAFAGDFHRDPPKYGPKGDLCDGFQPSDGVVFQYYAPDALKLECKTGEPASRRSACCSFLHFFERCDI